MKRIITTALAAVLLCTSAHAAGCAKFDILVERFEAYGAPIRVLSDEELSAAVRTIKKADGVNLAGATRGLIVGLSTSIMVGIEVDGCTVGPIAITRQKVVPQSGRGANGMVGA